MRQPIGANFARWSVLGRIL